MVHIIYREHRADAQFAGRTVAEARTAYDDAFRLANAIPTVNGQQVTEDHVLADGDKLEFIESGRKAA